MTPSGSASSREWFGDADMHMVYQWHHDSFVTFPPGAELIASSAACPHQAFVIGPHLGMQFHIEINAEKIAKWMETPGASFPLLVENHPDSVQSYAAMMASSDKHLGSSYALAQRIYQTWRGRFRK